MNEQRSLRIGFVHPDLGIGGAERLIVDAAVGLQSRGHQVFMYTSHHNPQHCFPETTDGTLRVTVHGDFYPRSLFGGLHVLFAMLRSSWLCWALVFKSIFQGQNHDVFIVDQVSIGIPILKLTGSKILFYCHFPDKMLAPRTSRLRAAYRWPFDWAEELTTRMADEVVVNSRFTRSVVCSVFPTLRCPPAVVYPGVKDTSGSRPASPDDDAVMLPSGRLFLSINRFERKKNLPVAVQAFARANIPDAYLVVAGGYDVRVAENSETLASLQAQCDALDLPYVTLHARDRDRRRISRDGGTGNASSTSGEHPSTPDGRAARVLFLPSISEALKRQLLASATALVYTPSYEHFGIVPVEAMLAGVPVIAVGNGGPAESVVHKTTGYLCRPGAGSKAAWTDNVDPEFDLAHFQRTVGRHATAPVARSAAGVDAEDEALVEEFSQGLQWIAQLSGKARASLMQAARERAQRCFSEEACIDGFVAALASCFDKPKSQ